MQIGCVEVPAAVLEQLKAAGANLPGLGAVTKLPDCEFQHPKPRKTAKAARADPASVATVSDRGSRFRAFEEEHQGSDEPKGKLLMIGMIGRPEGLPADGGRTQKEKGIMSRAYHASGCRDGCCQEDAERLPVVAEQVRVVRFESRHVPGVKEPLGGDAAKQGRRRWTGGCPRSPRAKKPVDHLAGKDPRGDRERVGSPTLNSPALEFPDD